MCADQSVPELFRIIMEGDRSDPLYKVVLVGDVGVGKTSIFHRYDKGKFLDYRDSTIGMDKLNKDVTVDGHRCKVRSNRPHFYVALI